MQEYRTRPRTTPHQDRAEARHRLSQGRRHLRRYVHIVYRRLGDQTVDDREALIRSRRNLVGLIFAIDNLLGPVAPMLTALEPPAA